MPTLNQNQKISHIHQMYVERVAPLIDDLEAVQGYDITPLHNEVRAMMGHLSRCFLSGQRDVTGEINKAAGHLDRLTLDTYKVYALYFTELESDFEKRYKWVDLSSVDNHSFYNTYFNFSFQGREKLLEARKLESIDKRKALKAYEEMYAEYYKMMTYLAQHQSAGRVQKIKHIMCGVLALVGLVLSTAFASLISSIILFFVFL